MTQQKENNYFVFITETSAEQTHICPLSHPEPASPPPPPDMSLQPSAIPIRGGVPPTNTTVPECCGLFYYLTQSVQLRQRTWFYFIANNNHKNYNGVEKEFTWTFFYLFQEKGRKGSYERENVQLDVPIYLPLIYEGRGQVLLCRRFM